MRHLVSHAQEGQIRIAVVDDDSGELDQIGQLVWPDGYSLTEAAVLGTNLASFLKLDRERSVTVPNGRVIATPVPARGALEAPAPRQRRRPEKLQSDDQTVLDYVAVHPDTTITKMTHSLMGRPVTGSSWVRRSTLRLVDEGRLAAYPGVGAGGNQAMHYRAAVEAPADTAPVALRADGQPRKRRPPDPAKKVKRYISMEEILDVVANYPEGITARQIAERLWRSWGNSGELERWVTRSVENRLAAAQGLARGGGRPLPFRLDYREEGSNTAKYVLPL